MDWTAVGGIAAAATALVAIGALLVAATDSRKRTRPFVVVGYQIPKYAQNALYLVVRNVGATPARDIQVEFDPPLSEEPRPQSVEPIVAARYRHPIPVLGPGEELSNSVHVVKDEPGESDVPEELAVTVTYQRPWKRRYRDTFLLRTAVYTGHTYVTSTRDPETVLKSIAKGLANVRSELRLLRSSLRRDKGHES